MKYENYYPHRHSSHSKQWTIRMLKDARLAAKNHRRAAHGLPPLTSYAHVK